MLWPCLTLISLAALVALHFWWQARFRQAQAAVRRKLADLQEQHQRDRVQVQTQQEAVFNSMAEGLLLLDEKGRIQLANRAFVQLFGVSANLVSRPLLEALRLHELAHLVEQLNAGQPMLSTELKLAWPGERWIAVNGAAVFNGAGRRYGTVLVFHDLTRLKHLERARKEFVANVSHELRTPLSLVAGYVETLLDGAKDNPETATKFLRTIERNTQRLSLLIEDLLAISELESGRGSLSLQMLSLRAVVARVLEDFSARAATRKIALQDRTPDLALRADPVRLEQVLGNLIDNAIKYGRNQGTVTVWARLAENGQVEVSVQDDGPGIPAEALDRLFERFYRVDKARSREQGGTGLGLSIVKHIIQGHGGKVWAKSQPGVGTTFYFTLPAAAPGEGEKTKADATTEPR